MLYLKSLVDNTVFTDPAGTQEKAERASSEVDAFDAGIQAEKDSILFYMEMRDFMGKADREMVKKIIDEERSHLRQLVELKQAVQKG